MLDDTISYHLPTLLGIKWAKPHTQPRTVRKRSFKHFNEENFRLDFSLVPWSIMEMFQSPDDQLMVFESLFLDVLNEHAPIRNIHVKKRAVPWITKYIRIEMDLRNKFLRQFTSSRSSNTWHCYQRQRNFVCRLQRESKRAYFLQLIASGKHPSSIWKALR